MSVCPSVYLFICMSVRLSIYPSVHMSVCPSFRLPIYPSIHLSVCPSVRLSVCRSICQFVCPSVCLSVLSIHLSIHQSFCLSVLIILNLRHLIHNNDFCDWQNSKLTERPGTISKVESCIKLNNASSQVFFEYVWGDSAASLYNWHCLDSY
jgi:hypothetical protein